MHDALNIDIVLYMPPELEKLYDVEGVYTGKCILVDIPVEGTVQLPHAPALTTPACHIFYRCHIRGIGKKGKVNDRIIHRQRQELARSAKSPLIRHTDMAGGWVSVRLSDIDTYGRVLITLYDIKTGEDLRDVVHRLPLYNSIYERYEGGYRAKHAST
jgi:hypothetical protein